MATKEAAVLEENPTSQGHCSEIKEETMAAFKPKAKKRPARFEKGIINQAKRAKEEENGWRPKLGIVNYRKFNPSRQMSVNGVEITLRQCRSYVMFEIDSFTKLLAKSLPLSMDFQELNDLVSLI